MAGFLSFFLGPALAGAVFGFFLGFLAGLFEDLSIFLQIGDMFNAISQFPQMIGNLISNPGLIVQMIKDMVNGHMMRCNIVNPYLTQDSYGKDASWWGRRVVKKFWGESDLEAEGMGDAIVFSVACTVSSVIGYLIRQFIVGKLVTGSFDLFLRFPPRPFEAGWQRLDRLVDTHPQHARVASHPPRPNVTIVIHRLAFCLVDTCPQLWHGRSMPPPLLNNSPVPWPD